MENRDIGGRNNFREGNLGGGGRGKLGGGGGKPLVVRNRLVSRGSSQVYRQERSIDGGVGEQ